jgi:ABC-type multidrug transport system ATPase subunit
LHDPPLLLLDEPDTGLDAAAWGVLADLLVEPRRTVVLTTHNLAASLGLGTRLAVLARGRLVHTQAAIRATDAAALDDLLRQLARR